MASGEYDMAMTLLSFAGVGQQGRVRINEPREGYIPLPQVIAWKQGTRKSLMTFADILTDPEMQTYLSNQDAWTVKEGVPLWDSPRYETACRLARLIFIWMPWRILIGIRYKAGRSSKCLEVMTIMLN